MIAASVNQSPIAIAIFDIDGVVRDTGNSYHRALADTVEAFTAGACRPSHADIDRLKEEGLWNNDWHASREMVYRHYEAKGTTRESLGLDYDALVDFFQRRYRGANPDEPSTWDGYITEEPLLMSKAYLEGLSAAGIPWGFFSGATPGSAHFILEQRLQLQDPVLVAMGDAPGKPEPTGLFMAAQSLEDRLNLPENLPVIYSGDTVADMYTVQNAKEQQSERRWLAIGVLPPHAQQPDTQEHYEAVMRKAGAEVVVTNVEQITPTLIHKLLVT